MTYGRIPFSAMCASLQKASCVSIGRTLFTCGHLRALLLAAAFWECAAGGVAIPGAFDTLEDLDHGFGGPPYAWFESGLTGAVPANGGET
mmetsp:Transcript_14152/g.26266  ORF Transcript_14152/g.26266 Transcript_14152/m.26266 type:complete len:90 (+) Transcript_14152:315-584(+)